MRKRIIYANITYMKEAKVKNQKVMQEETIKGVVFTEGNTHYKGILVKTVEELKFLGYKNNS